MAIGNHDPTRALRNLSEEGGAAVVVRDTEWVTRVEITSTLSAKDAPADGLNLA
jgi:hypothetical protein